MFREQRQIRSDVLSLGLPGLSEEAGAAAIQDAQKVVETYEDSAKNYVEAEYEPGVQFAPGEEELFDAAANDWKAYKELVEREIKLYKTGKSEDRAKIVQFSLSEGARLGKAYTASMKKLIDFLDADAKKSVTEAQSSATKANWLGLIIVVVGFFFTMTVGYFVAASISKSIKKIADDLSNGAETVTSAAVQISSASTELSASSTEQAAALQQTVASLEEVSAMVGKNAENARRSQEGSVTSQDVANRGNQVVNEMIQSIQDISDSNAEIMSQVESSNQEISQVVKVIAEIGDKTKVINDIVFQTKLLSFNASVEAARAGEHGKGFAVVAEEVGNLAQMSGNAAKEISQLLENSIQKVESTVNTTKAKVEALIRSGKEKVEAGSATARRCGEVLEEIVRNVSSVGSMVSEIASASNEQAQGVAEINKAMNQMDQVTQQNATASQQASSAAESLTRQAEELRLMVQALSSTIDGEKSNRTTSNTNAKSQGPRSNVKPTKNQAQVVDLGTRRSKRRGTEITDKASSADRLRKAAGAELVPSNNDPRFEDV